MLRQGLCVDFIVNNQRVTKTIAPNTTTLQLIREQLGLTGSKEVCAEGDCGACTIALGKWETDKFVYRAINSCLLPAVRLHGCHVITVEGLAKSRDQLHPFQKLMLEYHAVQCGYCTPGMIMSLFCLFANNPIPSEAEILAGLEGNLCRCTGYHAIIAAAREMAQFVSANKNKINQLLFPDYVLEVWQQLKNVKNIEFVSITTPNPEILQKYYLPQTLAEMFTLIEQHRDQFKIINGGTDLMVSVNLQQIYPKVFIDISQISELNFIKEKNEAVVIGGNVTFHQLQKAKLIAEKIPILQQMISRMASQQIRNIATLAGNIANASPVADMACVLLGLGAKLILQSKESAREVVLEEFYHDYKVTALDTNQEIISKIMVPIASGFYNFEKSSKRGAVDISTANSMFNLVLDGKGVVKYCRIAFGGVAKFPILAKQCSDYLKGKKLDADVINEAAKIAMQEFTPISDVRGSHGYRSLLIRNHIIKHFARMRI